MYIDGRPFTSHLSSALSRNLVLGGKLEGPGEGVGGGEGVREEEKG